jgi:hypothetical protein
MFFITDVTQKLLRPSPLAPLPQERGTRKNSFSPSPTGERAGRVVSFSETLYKSLF